MFNDPTPPPAEWLHSKECLAEAIISAVQNLRDDLSTAHDFRLNVQANLPLQWADEYLTSGTQTCTCARTCPRGNGAWKCTEGSESSRAKYCDECLGDRISAAVDDGNLDLADEWGYQLWSRLDDDDLRVQRADSLAFNATREVATCDRILGDRGYES